MSLMVPVAPHKQHVLIMITDRTSHSVRISLILKVITVREDCFIQMFTRIIRSQTTVHIIGCINDRGGIIWGAIRRSRNHVGTSRLLLLLMLLWRLLSLGAPFFLAEVIWFDVIGREGRFGWRDSLSDG